MTGRAKFILRLCALCFIISNAACGQSKTNGEVVIVDQNVEIPIKACVEINSKIFGGSVEPVELCKCLIPRLYADLKNDPQKLKLLKDGNWDKLSWEKKDLIVKYYQSCMDKSITVDSTTKLTITPTMAGIMKKQLKDKLKGTGIEKTNDVDKYCDCLISSMQTDFSANEIMQPNFNQTASYQKMNKKCLAISKKDNTN